MPVFEPIAKVPIFIFELLPVILGLILVVSVLVTKVYRSPRRLKATLLLLFALALWFVLSAQRKTVEMNALVVQPKPQIELDLFGKKLLRFGI